MSFNSKCHNKQNTQLPNKKALNYNILHFTGFLKKAKSIGQ